MSEIDPNGLVDRLLRVAGPAEHYDALMNNLMREAAAEIERLTRERDGLVSGLSALVHCQSSLTRSQMREAAADLLTAHGLKPIYLGGDQSPFVTRAESAEADLARAREALAEIYALDDRRTDPLIHAIAKRGLLPNTTGEAK